MLCAGLHRRSLYSMDDSNIAATVFLVLLYCLGASRGELSCIFTAEFLYRFHYQLSVYIIAYRCTQMCARRQNDALCVCYYLQE